MSWEVNRDALLTEIDTAFANVTITVAELAAHDDGLVRALHYINSSPFSWRDIPGDWIEYNYDLIPFLPARELRFFLPAYMRHAIVMLHSRSNVLPFLVYSLCAAHDASLERFSALSIEQGRTVRKFLESVAALYEPGFPLREARLALNGYWGRFV